MSRVPHDCSFLASGPHDPGLFIDRWDEIPAFIIEQLDDGRYTIFVPSVPTPLAGAVYVLSRDRAHPLVVPFAQAVTSISRWGSGAKELVAAIHTQGTSRAVHP